jgi:polyhydroxyalkanoate synthesis regulator phasin
MQGVLTKTKGGKVPTAKLPEKVEDWTPPWADGEFDEDKAKGLIFNSFKNVEKLKAEKSTLTSEKAEAERKLADAEAKLSDKPKAEEAKDAEITRLKSELAKLENGRPEDLTLIEKYRVALEVGGLTLRDAERLVGVDHDELVEDARDLSERLGNSKGDGDDGGSSRQPPRRQPEPITPKGNGSGDDGTKTVVSVDDLIKQDAQAGPGLNLPFLTR